jgi:hypothetical protein
MLTKALTGALVGMAGALVEVEVDIAEAGLPSLLFGGLPDPGRAASPRAGPRRHREME